MNSETPLLVLSPKTIKAVEQRVKVHGKDELAEYMKQVFKVMRSKQPHLLSYVKKKTINHPEPIFYSIGAAVAFDLFNTQMQSSNEGVAIDEVDLEVHEQNMKEYAEGIKDHRWGDYEWAMEQISQGVEQPEDSAWLIDKLLKDSHSFMDFIGQVSVQFKDLGGSEAFIGGAIDVGMPILGKIESIRGFY